MMKTEIVKLSDITPYFNNPRENFNAVAPVMESIKRFGFTKPIIVDKKGVIIAGHTRYIAAFQLGMKKVPVIYSDMDEEKAKLFRIADNKLAEKSGFDEDALVEELRKMEVPEDMQAFFFEDIRDLLNFDYGSMEIPADNPLDGDGEESTDEGGDENGGDNPDEGNADEDEHEVYVPYTENGKRLMKVVCPYCNNIETIEL